MLKGNRVPTHPAKQHSLVHHRPLVRDPSQPRDTALRGLRRWRGLGALRPPSISVAISQVVGGWSYYRLGVVFREDRSLHRF